MKISPKGGLLIVLVFAGMQFFKPNKNEGESSSLTYFITETKANKEVVEVLKSACFDCHSSITKYPWYYNITPVNYWMAHHIEEGKEHLNFSEWQSYSLKKKAHKMEEIYEEMEEREMPLKSYTWTHTDARLTENQIKTIVDWAKEQESIYEAKLN
ncbi:heme-binding domain-containing protein [Tenacibaculum maritimum]|uniref:heme-binding domain-containing protein n=1 Tax=Tenacibaculum maritimum TaxID=107401 RepID=UPI0012E6AFBE|nr:heme-binding domain-containing protein [Tenacibaculum maritimum]MCD9561988.1 heme-binding domain-containing protein [Tenacibaculum maritimum]MCD9565072.1 heme-binding domain-containing protein [Tenacibaculum maritimum]MCD9579045.1 heme-binding domain-containing protein [Tenacibaculum maritimum]MCD9595899.1 heme-binding domain-containing protein [Tenacibaculum maritimum]MCD9614473.1 heme-binding domain-containing protein [Tenacibaculum maritimum]